MLGQNDTYDYNTIRNHHYKVTLGFRGYANQPDWHIEYMEPDNTIFVDPTYYISYGYNHRAEFPVRIRGDIQQLDIEIVENNWAPYDTETGTVPEAEYAAPPGGLEQPFRWNKVVYDNVGSNFYYGLQRPWSSDGTTQITYSQEQIALGAPEKVTPIWAGFLALQVEDHLTSTLLPGEWNTPTALENFKKSYYANHQNVRKYTKEDLEFSIPFDPSKDNQPISKIVGSGNNRSEVTRASDGSITVAIPMWTRQKTMLGVSGFTGNNPYETFQRKAMVKIEATFNKKNKDGSIDQEKVTKYMPVFQVRRVVNPKGVWRSENGSFKVQLCHREGAAASKFDVIKSEGAWHAYVRKTNGTDFITLSGGTEVTEDGIIGATGSPIEFDIVFHGSSSTTSHCAIVEVEYHGLTCNHSIFVRQGYSEPLQIVEGGAYWSTYSLFRCVDPQAYKTQWDANNPKYIEVELTANPLTLGTLFKRANYNGILISNNQTSGLGALDAPGWTTKFEMSDQNSESLSWGEIQGLVATKDYEGWKPIWFGDNEINTTFEWGRFKVTPKEPNQDPRYYKLPSNKDFQDLVDHCDFGVGVVYTDGTTETALTTEEAFGFEDAINNGTDDEPISGHARGIRGVIAYNPDTANQLFFSIGARGMGRRTITGFTATSYNDFGMLRYSGVMSVLYQDNDNDHKNNQYRPIPYNMPAVPGAIYWIDKLTYTSEKVLGWEMNYFDLNFNQYTYPISRSFTKPSGSDYTNYDVYNHGGDALPVKLVLCDPETAPQQSKRKKR